MFQGFANVWTPIELSKRIKRRSRPYSLTIAGERVVLFRDDRGAIAALLDRCPHRGVALSLGHVDAGKVRCPFHGWEFDKSGACTRVPLNPDARCELLSATALPVRERGGLIWLYTAPEHELNSEPEVPSALIDSSFHRYYLIDHWRAHWTRAMENMLDMPHVPFVHRRTIGFAMSRRMRRDSRLDVTFTPTPQGGRIQSSLDGGSAESELVFVRPNAMTLQIPIPNKQMRIHVFCVPMTAQKTRMIVISARNFGKWNPLSRLFDQLNRLIVLEDKAIVESSDPPEVPPPGIERSVASDRPTLQFRKYYLEQLRPSSAAPAERLLQLSHPS